MLTRRNSTIFRNIAMYIGNIYTRHCTRAAVLHNGYITILPYLNRTRGINFRIGRYLRVTGCNQLCNLGLFQRIKGLKGNRDRLFIRRFYMYFPIFLATYYAFFFFLFYLRHNGLYLFLYHRLCDYDLIPFRSLVNFG